MGKNSIGGGKGGFGVPATGPVLPRDVVAAVPRRSIKTGLTPNKPLTAEGAGALGRMAPIGEMKK